MFTYLIKKKKNCELLITNVNPYFSIQRLAELVQTDWFILS